jgi:enamine deaminase RidA (YjgF/YER057c/UK114 family)
VTVVHAGACSTALRRFTGPEADELAILCRPEESSADAARQAEAVYRALGALLAAEQASFQELATETLFLRDIGRDLPGILGSRTRVLSEIGRGPAAPPSFVQQAPLDRAAAFELAASVVIPRDRDAWSLRDIAVQPSCPCAGCARSSARLIRLGEETSLHTTNLYGTGADGFEQASEMFCAAERLLEQCGMRFGDVVRTWIHLRDIDRDYDALNRARREFFRRCGIERLPASTGVQGAPFPAEHDFSIRLHAVKSSRPLDATPMSTPALNEAWSYGSDFSRGLRVAERNKVALYVSGTASIDEGGQTVHLGDFADQVDRMLHNVESLLVRQGAGFGNLISGVVYLKNPADAPLLRGVCRERGFDGFPCALVEAPLCRRELLCEAEAVAMLPLPARGA